MRIAITDANIFIDLIELEVLDHFFSLDIEVQTTVEVYSELYPEQQAILKKYRQKNRLIVVVFEMVERIKIMQMQLSNRISDPDRTVLYLANQLDAMVLSSDKLVREAAKNREIEHHGMLWIFDQFIQHEILSKETTLEKLNILLEVNSMFKGNRTLMSEIEKRKKNWLDS